MPVEVMNFRRSFLPLGSSMRNDRRPKGGSSLQFEAGGVPDDSQSKQAVSIDLHAAPFPIPKDLTVVGRTRHLIVLLHTFYRTMRGRCGDAELPSFCAFAANDAAGATSSRRPVTHRGALEAISLSATAAS